MKNRFYPLIIATSLPLIAQTLSAQVLLTDNFTVSANSNDPNFDIGTGRQGGTAAISTYTSFTGPFGDSGQHQVGNLSTDVGQPGGAANSNVVLLYQGGFYNDLDIASAATGPLVISFDMYTHGNPNGVPGDEWGSFSLTSTGNQPTPLAGAGQFGFLQRINGGMQVFQNGNVPGSLSWDTAGFALGDHWSLTFSDTAGTGSAFNGNGSQVTFVNGSTIVGTLTLGQLNSSGLHFGFTTVDREVVGIDNVSVSVTPAPEPSAAVLLPAGFGLLALVRRYRRA